MKQFAWQSKTSGKIYGPGDTTWARPYLPQHERPTLAALQVGETWVDCAGDTWTRLPDRLQDDVPLTATDVVEARTSASRVRQSLRLERIAAAAMAAIISKLPVMITEPSDTEACKRTARGALKYAQALIAELDKQA